ncbi:hypothetical protein [Nocardia farcinica]|nr:hypothetical protein [Nocardia farcinica]
MRKILARITAVAAFTGVVSLGSTGSASAITEEQCVNEGGGIVIYEMDGTKTCLGGFYTGQQILFS